MKVTVVKRLNKRNYPTTEGNMPLPSPLEPGDIIDIVEEVKGSFLGTPPNNIWYKARGGYYVWSGGTSFPSLNEKIVAFLGGNAIDHREIANLEFIDEYIQKNESALLDTYMADSVIATLKSKEGFYSNIPCLQFIVSKKGVIDGEHAPEKILVDGKTIITDVLEEEIPEAYSTSIFPGSGVIQKGASSFGTLGFKAFRKIGNETIAYFVSCFHVFSANELSKGKTSLTSSSEILSFDSGASVRIGKVVEGVFDPSNPLDISLMQIEEAITANVGPKPDPRLPFKGYTNITQGHVDKKLKVFGFGAVTGKMPAGMVKVARANRPISFNGTPYNFKNIIFIAPISKKGDSGSVIFDDSSGKIVGVLFAGGSQYSYLIPITSIIIHFKITPYHATEL